MGIEKTWNRGPFTKEEDELILKGVKIYGNEIETFKDLAINLNRPYHLNIKTRYELLMNKQSKTPSNWTIDDDKHLIELLFKVNKKLYFKGYLRYQFYFLFFIFYDYFHNISNKHVNIDRELLRISRI